MHGMDKHHRPNRKMAIHRPIVALVLLLTASLLVAFYSRADAPRTGDVKAQRGLARTVTYTYDAAGRLVQEDYGDGKVVTYTYDATGNLVQMSGPTLTGDMDSDCDVDIVDIMVVASRWNTRVGDARYDAHYDLDSDGDIDIVDIMLVATHWNERC